MNKQLAITTSKPIAYRLPNVELINALPYAQNDAQLTSNEKNRVKYMIKTEQNLMNQQNGITQSNKFLLSYYAQILPKLPQTNFLDSQKIKTQLAEIQNKNRQRSQIKKKQQSLIIPQIVKSQVQDLTKKPKKQSKKPQKHVVTPINENEVNQNYEKAEKGLSLVQINNLREAHLLVSDELSPAALKAIMASLDKQKQTLKTMIEIQRLKIQNQNKVRMYQQLQAQERERTIEERIKIMIKKRRKPNEYLEQ